MLYAVKKDSDDKNIIAVIGERNCGKTTTFTLFHDALSNDFLDIHDDKYYIDVSEGYDKLVRIHNKIFMKGLFPQSNLSNTISTIRLKIAPKDRVGKDMELIVHDIADKDVKDLLYKEYEKHDELIENIITAHKEQNDPYGPLSYLIYTKTYVILIDCNNFEKWGIEQIRLTQIITSIYEMQKKIENIIDNKMINPIAIIFTKSDKLEELSNNSQNIEQVSPKELFEKYFKLVAATLKQCHSGNLEFFQFNIKGVKKTSLEELQKIKNEEKDEIIKMEQEKNRENAMNQEYEKIKGENQPERSVKPVKELETEKEYHIKQELEDERYKIQLPIKYNNDEYNKFILWLIVNNA